MTMLSTRTLYLISFIVATLLISATFYLEEYAGFTPCPLCILQRITLVLLGITFLFAVILPPTTTMRRIIPKVVAICISAIGVLLSGRQVWLQHLPPDQNTDCGASLQYLMHVLPFDQVIARIFRGTAECSQKGWEFLHLSLADWSLFCFIVFFIFCLWQMKTRQ